MQTEAQKFMNAADISICYECDGQLFKHLDNADARSLATGAEVVTHQLSAGPVEKTKKKNLIIKTWQ
jgi:hypothetical protein